MANEFRYIKTVRVTADVNCKFSWKRKLFIDYLNSTCQESVSILLLLNLLRPVFLLNSCRPQLSASFLKRKPPILPKLLGHFAEFLKNSSLIRLSTSMLVHQCRFRLRFFLEKIFLDIFVLNIFFSFNTLNISNIVPFSENWIFLSKSFPLVYYLPNFHLLPLSGLN